MREKYREKEVHIAKIIHNYIVKHDLVVYGGLAIHEHLFDKGHTGIYDFDYDRIEYDVYANDADAESRNLGMILKNSGYENVKIVTGIKGNTRRVFIDLDPDAYIDITQADIKKHINPIRIDDFLVADPQYLKIDQYQTISAFLFDNYHRIVKVLDRIKLLEEYFPVSAPMITSPLISQAEKPQTPEILGGDIAFNYNCFGTFTGSAKVLDTIYGATVYRGYEEQGVSYKVADPHLLLYELYKQRLEIGSTNDPQIATLVSRGLDFSDDVLIYDTKRIEPKVQALPTIFL